MPLSNAIYLVNARSGNGAGEKLLSQLSALKLPARPLDFSRLESDLTSAKGGCAVVVAGGDGSVSAVATHPALGTLPLAFIPLGTANDLAREFGVHRPSARTLTSWLTSSLNSVPRHLDTWTMSCGDRTVAFCSYVSLGFEGEVLQKFSTWRASSTTRNRFINRFKYAEFGLRKLNHSLGPVVVADHAGDEKQTRRSLSLIVSNIGSYMGLGRSNSESRCDDGKIECTAVRGIADYVRMLLPGKAPSPLIAGGALTLRDLDPRTPFQADGEFMGEIGANQIAIRPRGRISILTPER